MTAHHIAQLDVARSLEDHGSTAEAFTFKERFPPPDVLGVSA